MDRFLEYAQGDAEFADYLRAVDAIIEDRTSVGLFDVPDIMYRDCFEDGMAPEEAAEEAIEGYW